MNPSPSEYSSPPTSSGAPGIPPCSLLVIEQDQARVFQALAPGTNAVTISLSRPPFPVNENNAGAPYSDDQLDQGDFAAIVEALSQAGRILLFRSGPGADRQIECLMAWAEAHRADLAGRIAASIRLRDRFLSNNNVLTTARNFLHGPG